MYTAKPSSMYKFWASMLYGLRETMKCILVASEVDFFLIVQSITEACEQHYVCMSMKVFYHEEGENGLPLPLMLPHSRTGSHS